MRLTEVIAACACGMNQKAWVTSAGFEVNRDLKAASEERDEGKGEGRGRG
jgi:hypothetical protein